MLRLTHYVGTVSRQCAIRRTNGTDRIKNKAIEPYIGQSNF